MPTGTDYEVESGICTEVFDTILTRFLSDKMTQVGDPVVTQGDKEVSPDICCQDGELAACETKEVKSNEKLEWDGSECTKTFDLTITRTLSDNVTPVGEPEVT